MSMSKQTIKKVNEGHILLGVTGSIGCGKTYACEILRRIANNEELSNSYVNVDTIRRNILSADSEYEPVKSQLVNQFGNNIVKYDGSICGTELGQIIFYDSQAMDTFKKITYPAIRESLLNTIKDNKGLSLVEWALLVEDDLLSIVDGNVLVVTCDYETQRSRLLGGDLPDDQIQKRIAYQMSNTEKISHIQTYQKSKGDGQLYVIDTTLNPSNKQYAELLEIIVRDLQ